MLTARYFSTRKPRLLVFGAAFLLAAVVLGCLRFPDRILDPQIRDEDGFIFFINDRISGLGAIFQPLNGYLYLLQRLIGLFTGLFHPSLVPYFYNGAALILTAATAARIAIAGLPAVWRAGFFLIFLLHPLGTYQFIHLTNVTWFTAALFPILAIEKAPTNVVERSFTLAAVALLGLSGPFAAIFAPLYLLSLIFIDRSRYRCLLTGVIAVTAMIQVAVMLNSWRLGHTLDLHGTSLSDTWRLINRFFVHSFFAHFADEGSILQSLLGLGAFALLIAGTTFDKPLSRHWRVRVSILLLGFALAYTASAVGTFEPWIQVNPRTVESRYYILPYLLFGWIIIALATTPAPSKRWMRAPAVILLFAAALTNFRVPLRQKSTWAEDIARIESNGSGIVRQYPASGHSHIYLQTGKGRHGFASGEELGFFINYRDLFYERFGLDLTKAQQPRNFPPLFPYSDRDSKGIIQFPKSYLEIAVPEGATGFRGSFGYAPIAIPPGSETGIAGGDGVILTFFVKAKWGQQSGVTAVKSNPTVVGDPPAMSDFDYRLPPGNWTSLVMGVTAYPSPSNSADYDFIIWENLAFEFK